MKKITTISFAFYYLILLVGLPLNIHYCMGMVEDIAVIAKTDGCCCDIDENPVTCCEDDQLLIQFQASEQLIKGPVFDGKIKVTLLEKSLFAECLRNKISAEEPIYSLYNDPPPENTPLWLKNKNFIFYG